MRHESGTEAQRLAYDTTSAHPAGALPVLSTWEVTSGSGQGNKYTWGGNAWVQTRSGGAAHVTDQSQILTMGLVDSAGAPKTVATTALPRFANNVNAPTGAASATAAAIATVQAGDVVSRSWSETDVDGLVVTCWGGAGFGGVYVALAATDIGTTVAAARLTGTSDNGNRQRYWVAKGERVFIPFAGLTYVYLVAMDVDGSEENHVDLVPV